MMSNIIRTICAFAVISLLAACSSSEGCKNDGDCPKGDKCINKKCYSNVVTPDPQVIDPGTGCSKDQECGICKKCDDGICRPVEGCDAGVVIMDASRDIIRPDVEDAEDAGDTGEVQNDVPDAGLDISDIDDLSDLGDIDLTDGSDIGTDVTDLSGCDAYSTLALTSRNPLGSLPRGTLMTINGQGFDNECGTLSVTFEGDPNPAKITEVTSSYIKVIVPGFAKEGPITVRSFGQEKQLSGSSGFKLTRRMFFSDFGNSVKPGNKFFIISFPNFSDFKTGEYNSEGDKPYPLLLDPINLMILVVSHNNADKGYILTAYNFADISLIKSVVNAEEDVVITRAKIDLTRNIIYLVGSNGNLYIHKTGTLELADKIPLATNLFGISLDEENNYIYLSGKKGDSGIVMRVNGDSYEVMDTYTFGDADSIGVDVIHHPKLQKLFVADFLPGYIYPVNLGDFSSDVNPVKLGDNCGPMTLALGRDKEKLYVVCNNAISAGDATASVKGFYADSMNEIAGSPLETKLVTAVGGDSSKSSVNLVYDDFDGYLFVTTDADNRVGVIVESTFTLLSTPQSPENTFTKSPSGNFGIVIEDW